MTRELKILAWRAPVGALVAIGAYAMFAAAGLDRRLSSALGALTGIVVAKVVVEWWWRDR